MERLLIIRGESHIRNTSESEILASLSPAEILLPRKIFDLDTLEFKNAIESGYWESLNIYLQDAAGRLLTEVNGPGRTKLCYFGVEETPTLIAMGAYLGDEHRIECRDYDRDRGIFAWPNDSEPVSFETVDIPTERIEAAGDVVIRVEISYPIETTNIDDVVPRSGILADITIRPTNGTPTVGLLRSQADVESFRLAVREVLAAVDTARPNTQVIHFFLAGPVSACLAAGQELRLRNGRRVQTYRYRAKEEPPMRPAILLTPASTTAVENPLTDEDRVVAAQARRVWGQALKELIQHASALKEESTDAEDAWPKYLVRPLQAHYDGTLLLPRIWDLVTEDDSVGEDHHVEFCFDPKNRHWTFDDRVMFMMSRAAGGDPEKMRRLARAFFWHEYVHTSQKLTRHTAAGVGGFPNCLERIDYVADLYGILHQTDYVLRNQNAAKDKDVIALLAQGITDAIDSFWTFELAPPIRWWQQRRLRRYLNWYWRREQILNESKLENAMALLCESPVIEVSGLPISTDGRRILLDFGKVERSNQLEIGIVSENNKLVRFPDSPTLSITEALRAFAAQDRDKIDSFFAALYDHAKG